MDFCPPELTVTLLHEHTAATETATKKAKSAKKTPEKTGEDTGTVKKTKKKTVAKKKAKEEDAPPEMDTKARTNAKAATEEKRLQPPSKPAPKLPSPSKEDEEEGKSLYLSARSQLKPNKTFKPAQKPKTSSSTPLERLIEEDAKEKGIESSSLHGNKQD